MDHSSDSGGPLAWLASVVQSLKWPAIVGAAFWCGRVITRLETRAEAMERRLKLIVDEQLPAVQRALAEVLGALMGGRR